MIRTKILPTTALLLLVGLLLAACGGAPGIGNRALPKEAAGELADTAMRGHDFLVGMVSSPGAASGGSALMVAGRRAPAPLATVLEQAGVSAAAAQSCTISAEEGDDLDGDEIPTEATYSFDCSETRPDGSSTFRAMIFLQDKDDTDPHSGYLVEISDLEAVETTPEGTSRLAFDESFDLTVDAGSYEIVYALDLEASEGGDEVGLIQQLDVAYTPDDLADPFVAGTFVIDGTTLYRENGESYQLDESSPGLHFDDGCVSTFDDGSITYLDSLGNELTITFHACNSVTITYNGSVVPAE